MPFLRIDDAVHPYLVEGQEKAGGLGTLAASVMERWFTRAYRDSRVAELRGYSNMLARTEQPEALARRMVQFFKEIQIV